MLQGPQFQQMVLFPEPTDTSHSSAAAIRNRSVPRGGQDELPFQDDVLRHQPASVAHEPSNGERLKGGEHPVTIYHGGNYPMMMTGPEIRHQFQALDGDRDEGRDYWDEEGSEGNRGLTVQGSRIASRHQMARVNLPRGNSTGWSQPENLYPTGSRRFETGDRIPAVRKRVADLPETDDELYDRKLQEAEESPTHNEWRDTRASGSDFVPHGAGVADQILENGYDMGHPVSLSTGQGMDKGWSNTAGHGAFGQYQVLGGHHRVAVMDRYKPNSMLSVQWAGSLDEAKQSQTY